MTTNPVVQILRAAARPAISIIFAATIAQVVVEQIDPPTWFLSLAIPCIVWWFGERAVTHVQERKQD